MRIDKIKLILNHSNSLAQVGIYGHGLLEEQYCKKFQNTKGICRDDNMSVRE